LHDQGIIHRDIKPGNLYAPAGSPGRGKLIDLGIARDTKGTQTTGFVPGTWEYMAPELFAEGGERGSVPSDLYSLGLCLYAALVGSAAFPRTSTSDEAALDDVVRRIQGDVKIDYGRGILGTNRRLQEVVRKATAHNPSDRYASAQAMQQDLEDLASLVPEDLRYDEREDDETKATFAPTGWTAGPSDATADSLDETHYVESSSTPPSRPNRKARPWLLVAGLLAAAGLGAMAVVVLQSKLNPPRRNSSFPAPSTEPGPQTRAPVPLPPPPPILGVPSSIDERPDVPRATLTSPSAGDADSSPMAGPSHAQVEDPPPPPPDPGRWRLEPPIGIPSPDFMARLNSHLSEANRAAEIHADDPAIRNVATELDAMARGVPSRVAAAAARSFVQRDPEGAAAALQQWQALQEYAPAMGLSERDFEARLAELRASATATRLLDQAAEFEAMLPDRLADSPEAMDRTARVAAWLDQRSADDVPSRYREELVQATRRMDSRLDQLVSVYLHEERDRARGIVTRNEDPSILWAPLRRLQQEYPSLLKRTEPIYATVVGDIAAWAEERSAFEARVNDLAQQIAAMNQDPDRLETLEAIADQLSAWPESSSAIIPPAEHAQRLAALRQQLREQIAAVIRATLDAALAESDPADIERSRSDLVAILHRAPTAAGMEMIRYQHALDTINAHLEAARPAPEDPNLPILRQAVRTGDWPSEPITLSSVDASGIRSLQTESDRIRQGFRHGDLVISNQPALRFIASVHGAWAATLAFPEEARPSLYDAVWEIAHDQLTLEFQRSLTGRTTARSPAQQARIRHEMLALLLRIEDITHRVSECDPEDPLRTAAVRFFTLPYFQPDILADARGVPIDLRSIDWLALANARTAL
jgi:hypothetical protein